MTDRTVMPPVPPPPSAPRSAEAPATDPAAWQPVDRRARWTVRMLIVAVVVDLLAVGSGVMELTLLDQATSSAGIDIGAANANDSRQMLVGIVQTLVLLATAVLFIRWLRRVTANLPAISPGRLRFGTGWATGGWFVPILNLWRPLQVVRQAWRRSDPDPASAGSSPDGGPVPAIIGLWWAAWIIANITGQASFRLTMGAVEIEEIVTASRITLVSDATSVVAGILAILVVRAVTRRQRRAAGQRGLEQPAGLASEGDAPPAIA